MTKENIGIKISDLSETGINLSSKKTIIEFDYDEMVEFLKEAGLNPGFDVTQKTK